MSMKVVVTLALTMAALICVILALVSFADPEGRGTMAGARFLAAAGCLVAIITITWMS